MGRAGFFEGNLSRLGYQEEYWYAHHLHHQMGTILTPNLPERIDNDLISREASSWVGSVGARQSRHPGYVEVAHLLKLQSCLDGTSVLETPSPDARLEWRVLRRHSRMMHMKEQIALRWWLSFRLCRGKLNEHERLA